MGEKNGAGTMGANQWIFLAEVRIVAGYPRRFAGIAGADFTG